MQYKNLLFNLSIFLFLLVSIIPGIFAGPPCIAENINGWSDGSVVGDNIYRLIITPPKKPVVVEVIQGGYFDNRNYCINVERDPIEIFGYFNVRTAPLHVICYEATNIDLSGMTTPSPSQNGCWQKGRTIETFTILEDSQKESIEYSTAAIADTLSQSYLLNNPTPTDYNISISTDITKKYYNYRTTDDPIVLGIAWFYLVLGLFLIFRFSLKIGER